MHCAIAVLSALARVYLLLALFSANPHFDIRPPITPSVVAFVLLLKCHAISIGEDGDCRADCAGRTNSTAV